MEIKRNDEIDRLSAYSTHCARLGAGPPLTLISPECVGSWSSISTSVLHHVSVLGFPNPFAINYFKAFA